MAGTLVANTINTDTGLFSTNNAYLGIAKAWVTFAGASGSLNNSFNISSVTRNSTGVYTINFATAMPNANYVVNINVQDTQSSINHPICLIDNVTPPTTTAFKVNTLYYNNTFYDFPAVFVSIIGS